MLFYGFATYGNAGWMREQVCKYMCPYARFQSVMFDKDTLVITYDAARGEPRGARSRKARPARAGLGDCVDCNICVQVCPTGIDIRKGLQYECIGCAACIDGCNQVMDKMGYPRGLIRYTTRERARAAATTARRCGGACSAPRTLVYTGGARCVIVGASAVSLALRNPLKVDVIRDRGALAREAAPGVIENVYRLQIMNTDETPRRFTIARGGRAGAQGRRRRAAGRARRRVARARAAAAAGAGATPATPGAQPHRVRRSTPSTTPSVARREKSTFLFPR